MTATLIILEIWTVGLGASVAGCALRLRPITVAMLSPAIVGLVLVGQTVA